MKCFKLWIAQIILALMAVSCTLTISTDSENGEPTVDEVATIVAQTLEAQEIVKNQEHVEEPSSDATTSSDGDKLPQPVYFLSPISGNDQVWRVETDGSTKTQITHEAERIDTYDVSRVDGSVVYVVSNQIYWVDKLGGGKKLLVDGGPRDESDEYFIYKRIGNLLWSPDGVEFSYLQGGLNFYDTSTGNNRIAMKVQTRQLENGPLILTETYSPSLWSPDGAFLLINVAFYEAGTQAVFDPLYDSYIEFQGDHLVCCQSSWFLDSSAVLVGSPWFGMVEAGLWSYNVWTGIDTTLLSTDVTKNDINYAGWPIQMPNGDLQYFYHHAEQVVDGDAPLVMVRSASDGKSGRYALRAEEFTVTQALWTPDGSGALIVSPPQTFPPPTSRAGRLEFVKSDGSPIILLDEQAYDMKWGIE